MANEEDKCTGHFTNNIHVVSPSGHRQVDGLICSRQINWESRFKSQALLDERALLTCMVYVDLNPIRAGIVKALSESEFTSIKERIEEKSSWLSGFGKGDNDLPFYISSYIDLVDETGHCIRSEKRGFISENTAKAIDQIGIDLNIWIDELKGFKSVGYSAVGTAKQLKEFSVKTKRNWTVGLRLSPALE